MSATSKILCMCDQQDEAVGFERSTYINMTMIILKRMMSHLSVTVLRVPLRPPAVTLVTVPKLDGSTEEVG